MAKGEQVVNLKRDWFAPNGSLYQVRDNPHTFPGNWDLPPTAEEFGSGAKTVATVQHTASGSVIVATAVEGDVKSVGNTLDAKGIEQPSQSAAAAAAGAKEQNLELGGRPRESGPLPAGTKKPN